MEGRSRLAKADALPLDLEHESDSGRQARTDCYLLGLLAATGCLLIGLCHYPPLLDFPVHLYMAAILSHPQWAPGVYSLSALPVPDVLWQFVLGGLTAVLPPLWAGRLLLVLYALALPGAAYLLCRAVSRQRIWPAYLALPLVWNTFALQGFLQFALTLPLGLIAISVYWRSRSRGGLGPGLAVAGMLILCYLGHFSVFLSVLLALGGMAIHPWEGAWHRLRALLLSAAPALALTVWYAAAFPHRGDLAVEYGLFSKAKSVGLFLLCPLPFSLLTALCLPLLLSRRVRVSPFAMGMLANALFWLISPKDLPPVFEFDVRFLLFALLLVAPTVSAGADGRLRATVHLRRLALGVALVSQALAAGWFASAVPRDREYAALLHQIPLRAAVGTDIGPPRTLARFSGMTRPSRLLSVIAGFRTQSVRYFSYYYELESAAASGHSRPLGIFDTSALSSHSTRLICAANAPGTDERQVEQDNRYLILPAGQSPPPSHSFREKWARHFWRLYVKTD